MTLASLLSHPNDWVMGLDLSLTGTGIALIGDSGIRTGLLTSKGTKADTLEDRFTRLQTIVNQIRAHAPENALIVVEGPSFASVGGAHHDRSGLWWLVVAQLQLDHYTVVTVPPTVLKKYVTGKGNASKDDVLLAVDRRYPDAHVTDNNTADAVVLAAMGARFLNRPVDDLPQAQLAVMGSVTWPTLAGDAA